MSRPEPPPPAIRALIVDDEPLAREGIALLLADDPQIEVIGECGNGVDAVRAIREHRPDLVFLDIQMPEMGGFEVIEALGPAAMPAVVFVTAYDQYAVRAFDVHALDYLLKPFDDERFFQTLGRIKEHIQLTQVSSLSERLMALLASYQQTAQGQSGKSGGPNPPTPPTRRRHRLAVKSTGRVVFVDVADIDWIEAADYYVQLHVGERTYLHRQTMASLEKELDPEIFLRIHRSAIVHRQRIREIRHHSKRDLVVVLDGGVELKVARSHRDKLQKLL